MIITKKRLKEIIKEELDYASAAGLEQDIEMRHKRGSFEKGDWGIHGDGGYSGEYSGYGDYPWVRAALEDLKDEDYDNQVKALSAIANELGISIRVDRDVDSLDEGEKEYPNNSTMRKLVGQAKMDGRYKEEDPEKLKKDYDKHVRNTRRDPKYDRRGKE